APYFFTFLLCRPPCSTLFPYTTLFRSVPLFLKVLLIPLVLVLSVDMKLPPYVGYNSLYKILVDYEVLPLIRNCFVIYIYVCTARSEEHTSELQSRENLVCRLLLEKKKI